MNHTSAPRWALQTATVFGAGLSPVASGTVGAAVAVVLHALIHLLSLIHI